MSVKAMGLVWDMECPAKINNLGFKPGHKYTLIAYADHADHNGKNIYPSVKTIARKTGYEERSVQRLTHELEIMGVLVEDGQGPRGTNRWYIPFSETGDKISPLTKFQGDKNSDSLGDTASGDIPSGDNLTPELNEPEPYIFNMLESNLSSYDWWEKFKAKISGATLKLENQVVIISDLGETAGYLEDRYTNYLKRALQISKDIKRVVFVE